MTWRNWSFLVVLILMNYIVFSVLGSFIFTPTADVTPTHTAQPTFTPGARALTPVAPLVYPFLTPSPIPGAVRATSSPTLATGTAVTATIAPTSSATRAP